MFTPVLPDTIKSQMPRNRALCHDILTRFMEPEEVPTSDTEPTVPDTTEVAPTESPVTSDPLPTEAPQTDATTPVDSGE